MTTTTYAATPGKRAARGPVVETAPSTTYVGRRVASRPVDAPSGALDLRDLEARGRELLAHRSAAVSSGREVRLDTGTIAAVIAGLEPADQSTDLSADPTTRISLPVEADRATTRPATRPLTARAARPAGLSATLPATLVPQATGGGAGRRRAARHTGRRGPLFRRLPSAPALLGLAALAVSAGGALSLGGPTLVAASSTHRVQADALSGSGGVGTVTQREAATSRSSARGTLEAASDDAVAPAEQVARQRSGSLRKLANQAESFSAVIKSNQWRPPLDSYRLTARFGQYGLWSNYHTGLDFAAPSGTPIHAIASGVITSTGYDGSYGNKTVMTLADGTELWYCHQTSYAVTPGEQVLQGDVIGYVGSTGNVTGPHVHIEVRPGGGDPIDPYPAFVEHGVTP